MSLFGVPSDPLSGAPSEPPTISVLAKLPQKKNMFIKRHTRVLYGWALHRKLGAGGHGCILSDVLKAIQRILRSLLKAPTAAMSKKEVQLGLKGAIGGVISSGVTSLL